MIVHLACDKGVGTLCQGCVEEKVACPTTNGNFLNRPAQELVAQCTFHIEGLLHCLYEIVGSQRLGQRANDTTPRLDAFYRLGGEETHRLEIQFLGNLKVHTALGIIHVGMHGDDADALSDGLHHRTLHISEVADGFQATKQQWMVRHNEVAPFPDGLVDNLFVDVQTQ